MKCTGHRFTTWDGVAITDGTAARITGIANAGSAMALGGDDVDEANPDPPGAGVYGGFGIYCIRSAV